MLRWLLMGWLLCWLFVHMLIMGWLQRRLLICLLFVHGLRMHRSRMHCLPVRWLPLHAVLAAHELAAV